MNLIEALHSEMDRVREIIKEYDDLPNNAGAFASGMMKAYNDLKEYEL
jgi:hypothetical protein